MQQLRMSPNNAIARIMSERAQIACVSRDKRSAIEILDEICAPFRGLTPDWNMPAGSRLTLYTDPHPESGLGTLLVEAFAPDGLDDLPLYRKEAPQTCAEPSVHWDEIVRPFLVRYGFHVVEGRVTALPVAVASTRRR